MKKVLTGLQEAAGFVDDGALITFGGATFQRAPMEFVRELARQGKKDLNLIDPVSYTHLTLPTILLV